MLFVSTNRVMPFLRISTKYVSSVLVFYTVFNFNFIQETLGIVAIESSIYFLYS